MHGGSSALAGNEDCQGYKQVLGGENTTWDGRTIPQDCHRTRRVDPVKLREDSKERRRMLRDRYIRIIGAAESACGDVKGNSAHQCLGYGIRISACNEPSESTLGDVNVLGRRESIMEMEA